MFFRHNDVAHANELLAANRSAHPRRLVASEGVFSMDGDLGPVDALAALARRHDAWLLIDDAHGVGVVNGGRGVSFGADVPLQMGTLSKALGSYGGYVCASAPVIDLVKTRAASFIYTTGLPPASAGAALAALDIVETDSALTARPLVLARMFARALDLPEARSAIVPLVVGEPRRALALSARLEEAGFLVTAIRPPTVPPGTARLRVAFNARHREDDVARLADATRDGLRTLAG